VLFFLPGHGAGNAPAPAGKGFIALQAENASLFEVSLCLSRACLGQMIRF
jgi:hypothetical protein